MVTATYTSTISRPNSSNITSINSDRSPALISVLVGTMACAVFRITRAANTSRSVSPCCLYCPPIYGNVSINSVGTLTLTTAYSSSTLAMIYIFNKKISTCCIKRTNAVYSQICIFASTLPANFQARISSIAFYNVRFFKMNYCRYASVNLYCRCFNRFDINTIKR